MIRKILFIFIPSVVFLVSCSAQEDFDNFTSKPVTINNPDTISKPGNIDNDDPVVIDDPVIENIVVAHRGAWKKNNFPQNSIASLREAIRLKCKGSEFDIALTADDSLVVNHDAYYNNRLISTSKYSDLITLKLSNGEILPTLREYIIAGKMNNSNTLLMCELKSDKLTVDRKKVFVEKVEKTIKDLSAQNLIMYSCFDYYLLKELRAVNSLVGLYYLNGDLSPEKLKLDNITGAFYQINIFKNNELWISSGMTNHINLGAWILNDRESINWAMTNKLYCFGTDEPELALSLIAK